MVGTAQVRAKTFPSVSPSHAALCKNTVILAAMLAAAASPTAVANCVLISGGGCTPAINLW